MRALLGLAGVPKIFDGVLAPQVITIRRFERSHSNAGPRWWQESSGFRGSYGSAGSKVKGRGSQTSPEILLQVRGFGFQCSGVRKIDGLRGSHPTPDTCKVSHSFNLDASAASGPADRERGTFLMATFGLSVLTSFALNEIENQGKESLRVMKVLLTNDDGIYAPGLLALQGELKKDFEVWVVAPESEMSAVGHGISLTSPLRVRAVNMDGGFFGYKVTGTPADCVKIAVQEIIGGPPDIILSGINRGANVGVNVLYSGTVSAAAEGAFLGIRSAAISLEASQDPDFRFAARFSREIIRYILDFGLKEKTALNVNVPSCPPSEMQGVAITRQGLGGFQESFEKRTDPRGEFYYWLSGETDREEAVPESDSKALREGWITITPISYDLTCHEEVTRLRSFPLPDLQRLKEEEEDLQRRQ